MLHHQKGSKSGHNEIQPRDDTRNDHDIKELEESQKNAKLGGHDRSHS